MRCWRRPTVPKLLRSGEIAHDGVVAGDYGGYTQVMLRPTSPGAPISSGSTRARR